MPNTQLRSMTIMTKKYNKLSKDYIELENGFNKMLDYYNS